MQFKSSLLFHFLRSLRAVNAAALVIAIAGILLFPDYFTWNNLWVAGFILLHCIAISFMLGRTQSRSFAFIYTSGHSRDTIWSHKMLASIISALICWLPAALLITLGIRCSLQDKLLNPYLPIMADLENSAIWFWLFLYGLLMPGLHFVWIRRAQPTKSPDNGLLLAVGGITVLFTLILFQYHHTWFIWLCWLTSAAVTAIYLLAGMILHRTVEVQK